MREDLLTAIALILTVMFLHGCITINMQGPTGPTAKVEPLKLDFACMSAPNGAPAIWCADHKTWEQFDKDMKARQPQLNELF